MNKMFLIIFYGLTVLAHFLIMGKVIPYQWVNGGMSPSYEAQVMQSVVSIFVFGALFLLVWKVAVSSKEPKRWQKYSLYGTTFLLCIGLLMQLLGTPFERYFMSVVVAIGIISHAVLIREKSKTMFGR